jgi:hypothetical protein
MSELRLIGYDSDSVAHDLIHNKGRYKIPDDALRDYGINPVPKNKVCKPFDKERKPLKSKKQLLIEAKATCYICGKVLNKYLFTWDHIIPKSKGGKKVKECCIFCNQDKGDMGLWEFIDFLKTLEQTEKTLQKIKNLTLFAIKLREL